MSKLSSLNRKIEEIESDIKPRHDEDT